MLSFHWEAFEAELCGDEVSTISTRRFRQLPAFQPTDHTPTAIQQRPSLTTPGKWGKKMLSGRTCFDVVVSVRRGSVQKSRARREF